MLSFRCLAVLAISCVISSSASADRHSRFTTFEAGQTRSLVVSPNGERLYVTNTPDGRLEVFDLRSGSPVWIDSIPVGLEPVAVAARNDTEVWVVNLLSDSVSIVNVSEVPGEVTRTLLVGDEPRDIVFAGSDGQRAFITAAHRGQNTPFPRGDFLEAGTGRADVWVYDAGSPGPALGGTPLTIVNLFGDRPRALTKSSDGSRVYAAVFRSGNQTTVVPRDSVCDGGSEAAPCAIETGTAPGGMPAPNRSHDGTFGPEVGLIVQFDSESGEWRDELTRNWNDAVRFDLPDFDVFEIDANAATPAQSRAFSGVGTVLFNLAVNPVSGSIYVTNTEANNRVRFEGRGEVVGQTSAKPPGEPASLRGHLHETRISVISQSGDVLPRRLNKHIPYDAIPMPPGVEEDSLAIPTAIVLSSDGSTVYTAAFGSAAIGVHDSAELEADTFVPDSADWIALGGGGPSGLALDEARGLLYVLTRFDNTLRTVNLSQRNEVDAVSLHNPEPAAVVEGRPLLYDARLTSSNGEAACASCHVFGDMDDLSWDLGDPDADIDLEGPVAVFHPLKGPMATMTLRGLSTHGVMHWRGDRGGDDIEDEREAFLAFNAAFDPLLGRDEGELADEDMEALTDFALAITNPPNPIRNLDQSFRDDEARGEELFENGICASCHEINRERGFFGTNLTFFGVEGQTFKTPQLRNMYQRVGMFGVGRLDEFPGGSTEHTGPQVRGYGFIHDGSVDTLDRFLTTPLLLGPSEAVAQDRKDIEAFLIAFDAELAPVVGQQVTITAANASATRARVELLVNRAATPFVMHQTAGATECDLTAHAKIDGEARGWVRKCDGSFQSDRKDDVPLQLEELLAFTDAGASITFTCQPPGGGVRAGVDRDLDGALNRDELDEGTDPADASSVSSLLAGEIMTCFVTDGPVPDPNPDPQPDPDPDPSPDPIPNDDPRVDGSSASGGCGCRVYDDPSDNPAVLILLVMGVWWSLQRRRKSV